MYSYTFDENTGGILLNSTPTIFSKEPRPVYACEMDLLGFSAYWEYENQNEVPYMWAESNAYWYRGQIIARIKGGDLYHAPILTPVVDDDGKAVFCRESGYVLQQIDIPQMCTKNKEFLNTMERTTVQKIVRVYEKYKNKLDIFHVAFSGGKDSAVLLDLVKKALPHDSFVVIFGDTGMEFPDTYKAVEYTQKQCEKDEIPFYIARSHFEPEESWKLFGPPSRKIRWCCSVHKSTPQTIKMREIAGKENYTGMDFVGVRKEESLARSTYTYENFGMKQKGQYSFNPILEWTSAEVWLYIYTNHIYVNEAYKKGNSRAGCLFCPMSGGQSDYFRNCAYKKPISKYSELIKETYFSSNELVTETYISNGGWNARTNGRDLVNNPNKCIENSKNGVFSIQVKKPNMDWREWIKTIGAIVQANGGYSIQFEGNEIKFKIIPKIDGYQVEIKESVFKDYPAFGKLFKQVFRKSAYCSACRVCETNCHKGCIHFVEGKVQIDNCVNCHQCHEIDYGCLMYYSLKHPQGGGKTMKSLNSFADHAPKKDWLVSFFDLKEDFFTNHTLGTMMYDKFRRFLKDAGLNDKNHFTLFAEMISQIGWEAETALGLMMINLAFENPQIEWYIKNFDIGYYYEREKVEDMLVACDVKPKDAKSIFKAYKRIVDTPFGINLNFGQASDDEIVRLKWSISDNRVVLYALYKFVEKCNLDDREFHLSYLFDEEVERDGISPVRMFGIYDEEEWKSILLGLSARYPEFINATFTNDLKTISLKDKTSNDVLELFKEEL